MTSEPEPEPRRTWANWTLAGLIAAFGIVVYAVTVAQGRADSALLFVGLPVLLAAALALSPGRTTHGRVFVATTIALLLASVALHEGAICVILSAPLVYAMAHGTTALIRLARRYTTRAYSLVAVPLLLVPGLEGTGLAPRITPEQSVEVVRVVTLPAHAVGERLATGPRPVPVRSAPLRLLGVPVPTRVTGDGLATGDRWMFAYPDSSHGPGGHLLTEVTGTEPGRVGFRFVEDTAITGRWVTFRHAEVTWQAVDRERTEVRVRVAYERGLDPSWYFGPLQDGLLHEGVGHLLDMHVLP
ncbi:hypothetical protein [Salinispora arenicola]|uniref:hypothetical protein n=1 Tax=Salinispora arenicola TaxID=168697 RepID=UPI00037A7028|nr:hypothetical protein [Salinispora arenicola]